MSSVHESLSQARRSSGGGNGEDLHVDGQDDTEEV